MDIDIEIQTNFNDDTIEDMIDGEETVIENVSNED